MSTFVSGAVGASRSCGVQYDSLRKMFFSGFCCSHNPAISVFLRLIDKGQSRKRTMAAEAATVSERSERGLQGQGQALDQRPRQQIGRGIALAVGAGRQQQFALRGQGFEL